MTSDPRPCIVCAHMRDVSQWAELPTVLADYEGYSDGYGGIVAVCAGHLPLLQSKHGITQVPERWQDRYGMDRP